jgi:hypothetical protein
VISTTGSLLQAIDSTSYLNSVNVIGEGNKLTMQAEAKLIEIIVQTK